jgi:hypothetical protein
MESGAAERPPFILQHVFDTHIIREVRGTVLVLIHHEKHGHMYCHRCD